MEEHKKDGARIDPGTFSFLQTGWWILHVVTIAIVFYLGYLYGVRVFR